MHCVAAWRVQRVFVEEMQRKTSDGLNLIGLKGLLLHWRRHRLL
jgi:hypothetical protein